MKVAPLIRAMRTDDIDAVMEVFRASVRLVARSDYTPEQVLAWSPDDVDAAAWARRYATREAWVADIDRILVGFIELESNGHLDMLYVHPAHQRQGVASALLRELEAAARNSGIVTLYNEASITARPFFESRGFTLIAPQTVALRGQEFVNFRMEKRLAAAAT